MLRKIAFALAVASTAVGVAAAAQPAQANVGYGLSLGFPYWGGLGTNRLYHYPSYQGYGPTFRTYSYAPNYSVPPYSNSWDQHVGWCQQSYRSYSLATDTFIGRDGIPHRCISP